MNRIQRKLAASVASGLLVALIIAQPIMAGAALAEPSSPMPESFFKPPIAHEGEERNCPVPERLRTEPADLVETDKSIRGSILMIRFWGNIHFRFKGPKGCTDWDFVLSQWQSTFGLPVTGVLTEAEIKSVLAERERIHPAYRAADSEASEKRVALRKQNEADNKKARQDAEELQQADVSTSTDPAVTVGAIGPEPTVLDVLPKWIGVSRSDCLEGAREAMNWARQQELQQRRYFDYDLWRTGVPSHWAAFSQTYPELTIWMRQRNLPDCPARMVLRSWLKAIGDASSNIDDPRSVEQSANVMKEARSKLAELKAQYAVRRAVNRRNFEESVAKWAEVEAHRSGVIDFDDLALGARAEQIATRLPQALCVTDGDKVSCQVKTNICAAEQRAISEGNPSRQRLEEAKEILNRCEFVHSKSAAARSSLLYAGKKIEQAELRFERGALVEVQVSGISEPQEVHKLLIRRHGAPQTQGEERTSLIPSFRTAPATTMNGQTVWVNQMETVAVNSTRFHHTWAGKGFVIEQTEGTVTILKTQAH